MTHSWFKRRVNLLLLIEILNTLKHITKMFWGAGYLISPQDYFTYHFLIAQIRKTSKEART